MSSIGVTLATIRPRLKHDSKATQCELDPTFDLDEYNNDEFHLRADAYDMWVEESAPETGQKNIF